MFGNGGKWDLLFDEEAGMGRGASVEHPRSIRGASLEHRWSMQGACKEHFGGIWGAWGVRGREDGAEDVGGMG